MLSKDKYIDKFFFVWALVLPITSVLLIPSIQGTTAGFMLAFMSIMLVPFLTKYKIRQLNHFYSLLIVFSVFLVSILMSQLSLSISKQISFADVILVDPWDSAYLFKPSMVTQSLYMVAALCTFVFVKVFYNEGWIQPILYGGLFLAVYGIYEVIFFFITGQNGDFLTNRFFGDGQVLGSAFQKMQLGSLTILRLKSLTGEPSMYAFTIMPFFLFALYLKKKVTATILGISLVLSTSTTFFIGIAIGFILGSRFLIRLIMKSYLNLSILSFVILCMFIGASSYGFNRIYDVIDQLLISKLTMSDISGSVRSTNFINHMSFYGDLPFLNKLFGVGFGYVRSTDFFSTLMVNTGLVGTLIFTFLFLYPVLKLGKDSLSKMLKLILVIIYVSMMIAVPEFSYLSSWLFLGIAYNQIYKKRFYLKVMPIKRNN